MSLLTESIVRARAQRAAGVHRNLSTVLTERIQKQAAAARHDIFLSHSFDDRELVLGVALTIEDLGYSVYLDWRDDPSLDRKNITEQTAGKLRARMKTSRCLFYSTTENASNSKWMPWELGYKDGNNTRVAILPVSRVVTSSYQGQEYLGIYPYVSDQNDTEGKRRLWIRRSLTCYVSFDSWLEGHEPAERK
ncbi:MAG: hypothetical protein FD165_936 [Gammaproteobacteria bacterium]|nr:MAG: hypothetical protein FD165_936 [Gammaproteobacteria bacterium]TND06355.1 MAG: hypothetical protein FD120_842 [Gammaproteobacteria bacterium]